MLQTKRLHQLVQRIAGNEPFEQIDFFAEPDDWEQSAKVLIKVLDQFAYAIEEIVISNIPELSKEKHISKLEGFRAKLLVFRVTRYSAHGGHEFDFERLSEYLQLLVDNLELSGLEVDTSESAINRRSFVEETTKLIDDISNSKFDELSAKAITIKLQSVRKIAELHSQFGDKELRTHVKMLMADFFAEWEHLKSQDEATLKQLRLWGGRLLKGSTRALGITADVSEIAGLITKE